MFTKEMYGMFRSFVLQEAMCLGPDDSFEKALAAVDRQLDEGHADGDDIDTMYALVLEAALCEIERLRPDLVESK